ncbi:unnamed protein product [Polarella glacialis]|uniref:EF-hand domain-containing protein n=1 Tax=Polarella glacialis TaxID=89957 RepID=A0A813H6G6_POLGL|nr:unnamed protein product [Polarella glacialis]
MPHSDPSLSDNHSLKTMGMTSFTPWKSGIDLKGGEEVPGILHSSNSPELLVVEVDLSHQAGGLKRNFSEPESIFPDHSETSRQVSAFSCYRKDRKKFTTKLTAKAAEKALADGIRTPASPVSNRAVPRPSSENGQPKPGDSTSPSPTSAGQTPDEVMMPEMQLQRQLPGEHATSMASKKAVKALEIQLDWNRSDCFVGVLILCNAVIMVMAFEWQGATMAVALGLQEKHPWEGAELFFEVMENVFTIVFLLELLIRIYMERSGYFKSWLNICDAVLVVVTCTELYILSPSVEGSDNNTFFFRLLRVGRLVRAIRIVRAVRLFRGLRVLVGACESSLPSLFWAMVLLGLCMTTGGLVIGNLLEDFILDENNIYEDRYWMWRHYGTAYRAIFTMYKITLAGNWPIYVEPVMNNVSQWFVVFFVLYVTIVVFAVIRVITAIFLQDTLDAAHNDVDMMVQERLRKTQCYVKKLEAVFTRFDTDGGGTLDEEELNAILKDPAVMTYLAVLDLEIHEGTALFRMLDDGEGQITFDTFIKGILRFKGHARSVDLIAMHADCHQIHEELRDLTSALAAAQIINRVPSDNENRQPSGGLLREFSEMSGWSAVGTSQGLAESWLGGARGKLDREFQI